jgi:hypothetical protein
MRDTVPVTLSLYLLTVICYQQLLKCRDKLFTLKQEFGNCPECPTKLGDIIT